jgi:hypothetical protein
LSSPHSRTYGSQDTSLALVLMLCEQSNRERPSSSSSRNTVSSLPRVMEDDIDNAGVASGEKAPPLPLPVLPEEERDMVGLALRSRARASACLTAARRAAASREGEPCVPPVRLDLDRLVNEDREDWLNAMGEAIGDDGVFGIGVEGVEEDPRMSDAYVALTLLLLLLLLLLVG